jgi:hypothetical protein
VQQQCQWRRTRLGRTFNRLDRTSLRLVHSLDYLVGESEQRERRTDEPGAAATPHQTGCKLWIGMYGTVLGK